MELLRCALATALAFRWIHVSLSESHDGGCDMTRKADAWLQRAPLGARFWFGAVDRSHQFV